MENKQKDYRYVVGIIVCLVLPNLCIRLGTLALASIFPQAGTNSLITMLFIALSVAINFLAIGLSFFAMYRIVPMKQAQMSIVLALILAAIYLISSIVQLANIPANGLTVQSVVWNFISLVLALAISSFVIVRRQQYHPLHRRTKS